ncbi:FAS1 domain-containing protein [Bombardia bombarda]|uniref:FAS1 domain-containing protein n=1 Tax=Bombardia bombarda TaxID=252184 RepID=A0AA39XA00_9PEZI|nr:FAS1 domain-containing protein [Bombardia bombarda]
MKSLFVPVLAFSAAVSSQLVLPLFRGGSRPPAPPSLQPLARSQTPLVNILVDPAGPGPVMPPPDPSRPVDPPSNSGGDVMLSDVMGRDRSINLFAGFVRDIESASQRLDDSSKNTTVLAPLNSAVEKLPRKPWEDPRDYGTLGPNAYEGDDGQDRALRNLRRFVEAHMLPVNPWPAGEKVKAIGDDLDIWWEDKDGTKLPGNIEVVSIASTVANGQVWILKGVRNYA